jgi:hypothetical protein
MPKSYTFQQPLDLASLDLAVKHGVDREGVIIIDKRKPTEMTQADNILLSGDSYFYNFLSSKVRLSELGILMNIKI